MKTPAPSGAGMRISELVHRRWHVSQRYEAKLQTIDGAPAGLPQEGAFPADAPAAEPGDCRLEQGAPQRKRASRLAAACAAALVLALGVGGLAYATGALSVDTSKANPAEEASPDWTTLLMSKREDAVYPGVVLPQSIQVRNNSDVAAEAAYVRVHVAVPTQASDFGDGADDQLAFSFGENWEIARMYDTKIGNWECTVAVLDYQGVLEAGTTTPSVVDEVALSAGIDGSGSPEFPVWVCSQAVQAGIWKDDTSNDAGGFSAEWARRALDQAFGEGPATQWASPYGGSQQ